MLYGYLFAAIAGVILLGVSLLGGHHDHDGPAGDAHDAGDSDGHHHAPSLLSGLLSLQLWTYLLTFGGLTGLALRLLARVPEPWCGLLALGVGAAAAALVRVLWRRAAGPTDSGTVRAADLVGQSGTVVLPFGKGQTGKIMLSARGGTIDVLAVLSEDQAEGLEEGEEVLILGLREGVAQVTRARALLR